MTGLVKAAFFSFTEVPAGHHREYNEWHALDHMPEQYRIEEIVGTHRWVLTPDLRPFVSTAHDDLARSQYFHFYLFTGSLERALPEFGALKVELESKGRFYFHRVGHFNAALRVVGMYGARRALVDARVMPFRPARGCIVEISAVPEGTDQGALDDVRRWYDQVHIPSLVDRPGVAGCWSFEPAAPPVVAGSVPPNITVRLYWLDDDPLVVAESLAAEGAGAASRPDVPVFRAVYRDNVPELAALLDGATY